MLHSVPRSKPKEPAKRSARRSQKIRAAATRIGSREQQGAADAVRREGSSAAATFVSFFFIPSLRESPHLQGSPMHECGQNKTKLTPAPAGLLSPSPLQSQHGALRKRRSSSTEGRAHTELRPFPEKETEPIQNRLNRLESSPVSTRVS